MQYMREVVVEHKFLLACFLKQQIPHHLKLLVVALAERDLLLVNAEILYFLVEKDHEEDHHLQ